MITARNTLPILFWIFIGTVILLYSWAQFRPILRGSTLSIIEPSDGATVQNAILPVSGFTKHAAYIAINGRQIFADEKGAFHERLLLSPGYTIITVTMRDIFGDTLKERRSVVYQPLPEPNPEQYGSEKENSNE